MTKEHCLLANALVTYLYYDVMLSLIMLGTGICFYITGHNFYSKYLHHHIVVFYSRRGKGLIGPIMYGLKQKT